MRVRGLLKKALSFAGHDGIVRINICLPPIKLQNQFAAFVNEIDKSKSAVKKALDETQLLFDSLMQEYFG